MDDFYLSKGRTYMYLDKPPTYAFGHGLSYTAFTYSNFRILPSTAADLALTATVDVANTGPCDGDEFLQLYAGKTDSTITRPGETTGRFPTYPHSAGPNAYGAFGCCRSEPLLLGSGKSRVRD